ncbi:glycosyltransferase family 2 protein [Polaribacter sp. SA4-12]|uniref:glycosyltransferase family 2 protein n=1 Tax=Polaribacter sp. SA4-12 TaxID=1312072 RepID=UPI000B583240|nr:glycosyltransferase family A protein [Polaribacter sp. SA4-12]ARV13806.1 hypothetical protein BTO07_01005 [Polaribacter sp. SA4-12]
MIKKPNLVSVIITTYNRKEYLEEAILSVLHQTYKNYEILVIDDGSLNNYAEAICNKYNNCTYFYKNNGGLSSARNFGIHNSKGDFIAFLDDDDYWREDKLHKQIELLKKFKNIDCIHSSASVVNAQGIEKGLFIGAASNKVHKRSGYVFWNALSVWVVKSPTPLIRKKVFKKDLHFDETIKVGEDIDFYQRMFFRHKVLYIDEPLAFYREYDGFGRLSLQKKMYIGIEKKMYFNFKKMGIKNPFLLQKIASRLLVSAVNRYNLFFPDSAIKLSFFDIYFFSISKLKKIIFDLN